MRIEFKYPDVPRLIRRGVRDAAASDRRGLLTDIGRRFTALTGFIHRGRLTASATRITFDASPFEAWRLRGGRRVNTVEVQAHQRRLDSGRLIPVTRHTRRQPQLFVRNRGFIEGSYFINANPFRDGRPLALDVSQEAAAATAEAVGSHRFQAVERLVERSVRGAR